MHDQLVNHLKLQKMLEKAKARGELSNVSKQDKARLLTLCHVRSVFYRKVDRKRYEITRSAMVVADSKSGEPILFDAKLMGGLLPKDISEKISKGEIP